MVAKATTTNGQILTEVAGSMLLITRNALQPGADKPIVRFDVQMGYKNNEYLLDENGEKVRLLNQMDPTQSTVCFTQEQVGVLFATPMKAADGTDTVLGEFLADLWDKAIRDDLALRESQPSMPQVIP